MYGQKNYNEIQGIGGKYRIAQIGCLLTSMCNLMKRDFGTDINPLQLNARFRDGGFYIDVDDGIRDDLAYGTISTVFPEVYVTGIHKGTPTDNRAIVKFTYKGSAGFNTHFCLVHDWAQGLIIDGWDGQVKSWNVYGGPIEYATYAKHEPVAITPVTPPQAPQPVENPDVMNVTVQAGWGITHVLKAAGYTSEQYGNEAEWDRIAQLNGSSSRLRLQPGQVIKVYKTPLPRPTPPAPVEPTPQPAVTPAPVENWKDSFKKAPGRYTAMRTVDVYNLESTDGEHIVLTEGQSFNVAGWFIKDGVKYYLAAKHANSGKWYGVPASALREFGKSKPADDDSDIDQLAAEIRAEDARENDIKLADEFKEFRTNLTKRETVVAVVAKISAALLKLKFWKRGK